MRRAGFIFSFCLLRVAAAIAAAFAAAMVRFRLAFVKPVIVLTHSPSTCSVMRFAGASAVVASAVLVGRAGLFPASVAVAPGCGVLTVAFVVLAVSAASSVVAAGAGLSGTSAFITEKSVPSFGTFCPRFNCVAMIFINVNAVRCWCHLLPALAVVAAEPAKHARPELGSS